MLTKNRNTVAVVTILKAATLAHLNLELAWKTILCNVLVVIYNKWFHKTKISSAIARLNALIFYH